jgi:hypothetical protein
VRGPTVEPFAVLAAKDRPFAPFADGQVDGSRRPGDERDGGGLVALAEDAQRAMAAFDGKILDVGGTRLAHSQSVQPEQHRQGGVGAVVLVGGEQEHAELGAVESSPGRRVHLRPSDVLRGVRRDSSIDVGEPVEAAHGRQPTVDRRRRQSSVFHPASVRLDVGPGRAKDGETVVGCPLEEATEIVAVRVQRAAAVASQECNSCELRIVDDEVVPRHLDGRRCRLDRGHGCSSS